MTAAEGDTLDSRRSRFAPSTIRPVPPACCRPSTVPMCGIAGHLSWTSPPDLDAVEAMTERLAHRGPDAAGVRLCGRVALGHRRLSVIDTASTNDQPQADSAGQVWIVFNGEIYNFRELRRALEGHGAVFRTQGDTEVLLEAYKRWGDGFLERLNGMFAFALWDGSRERLLLARDRAGEKPLYYQPLEDGGLLFASELSALRAHPLAATKIEPRAVAHYLSLAYTLSDTCILKGVEKLPAATFLAIGREAGEHGVSTPRSYWDLAACFSDKRRFTSDAEACEALAELLDDAVRLRLVSDVPLGAFLSGGIDSSSVVEAMARLRSASSTRTFSIGFHEPTYSELPQARRMAQHLGVDHRDEIVDVDMARHLPAIVRHTDEPFADTSVVPFYFLARMARRHVTVCLSGDGSDEIFAGYETYRADRLRQLTAWLPGWLTRSLERAATSLLPTSFAKVGLSYKLRHFLAGHALDAARAHHSWRTIWSAAQKRQLLRPELRELAEDDGFGVVERHWQTLDGAHPIDRAMYADIKTWLVDDILVKVDRATMAHALESRAPFLDHRLIEFAAGLPVSDKLRRLETKFLLKRAQRRRLPADVLGQAKRGFNAPVSHWLHGALGERAQRIVRDSPLFEWLDPAAIDRIWEEHRQRRVDHGLRLFSLTCLALWMRGAPLDEEITW